MATKKILMLTTGGTIGGNVAGAHEAKVTDNSGLQAVLRTAIQEIKTRWQIEVKIESKEIANKDSSDVNQEEWSKLAKNIHEEYDNFDGFLIAHGTNTMGYTTAALSFALENLNKPVVVTGAQVPAGMPGSDSQTNLENSLRVAVYPYLPVKGVVAVFGSRIMIGTRVKKSTEFDYDAFHTFQDVNLGVIGRGIILNETKLAEHNGFLTKQAAFAIKASQLKVQAEFEDKIAVLSEFPGMSNSIMDTLVEHEGIKGFIFRAFGAGDPCQTHHETLKRLKKKKIPVVMTTQAANGNSNFQVNESGETMKKNDWAIPAYDMSMEAMVAKLSWLLAQKLDYETIKIKMVQNLHGEVHVINDLG